MCCVVLAFFANASPAKSSLLLQIVDTQSGAVVKTLTGVSKQMHYSLLGVHITVQKQAVLCLHRTLRQSLLSLLGEMGRASFLPLVACSKSGGVLRKASA